MENDTVDSYDNIADEIAEYEDKLLGTQTAVESVDYPELDRPWMKVLSWLIGRVDEGTIKGSAPSNPDSPALVFNEGVGADTIFVTKTDGSQVDIADTSATKTAQNLSIVEDDTVQLQATLSDDSTVTLAGNSASSTDGNSLSDDTSVQNDAVTFPTVPLIDKTVANIETDYDIPLGGLAYSLVDNKLVINKP